MILVNLDLNFIIVKDEYCIFFDTKAMVPSLKMRTLDTKERKSKNIQKFMLKLYFKFINK